MMAATRRADWRDTLPVPRGRAAFDAPLGAATWFRVGGAADYLLRPRDTEDLAQFLAALSPELPVTIIGAAGRHGYKIVQTLKTAPSARTMAFDQATQTAYLSAATIVKILPPAPGKSHGKMEFAPGSFHILVVKAGKS